MQELLFLAHRLPYPPDKGDKIRSWHFLKGLTERYRVHLGCFVDDPHDWQYTDHLNALCASTCLVPLAPNATRLRSLRGLLDGEALTQHYYASDRLTTWVEQVATRPNLAGSFIYCSAMAQYMTPALLQLPCVADVVDVDSEKWLDYARKMSFPKSWIYRREGRLLRRIEQQIVHDFNAVLVATEAEGDLYRSFLTDHSKRLFAIENGVDAVYFSPDRWYPRPGDMGPAGIGSDPSLSLVFTGAMDYWPNIDAVRYFAAEILPLIKQTRPEARFFIVGSKPAREVTALHNGGDVVVTGRVEDVRPYVAHASAIVAPLRLARGVQNKVLEGMAMGKAVIASPEALTGIKAVTGVEILVGDTREAFAAATLQAIDPALGFTIGQAARARVLADYCWAASQARILDLLAAPQPTISRARLAG